MLKPFALYALLGVFFMTPAYATGLPTGSSYITTDEMIELRKTCKAQTRDYKSERKCMQKARRAKMEQSTLPEMQNHLPKRK